VKAVLDARLAGDQLTSSYERALDSLEECVALVKVGLSPTAALIGAIFIVAREGLEAVVILAALLAGLRGTENAGIRRRIGIGAWLALGATAVLFVTSRTLLQGLSHYGETLEAIISVLAVIILLMVTNWVFHKYYWTSWNARLRDLSKAAQRQREARWESAALVGVGFMTIFREGFETTLFLQSLILEAGLRPVLLGLALGALFIGAVGFAVFSIGAKLPYRKMLMVTGGLVIFVPLHSSARRSVCSRRSVGCRSIPFLDWSCRPGRESGWACIRPGKAYSYLLGHLRMSGGCGCW
jgi:high-affinity iron transporter